MKRLNFIWVIILIIVVGCSQSGIQSGDIITVDVTANYPHKELILQDFMDVEYIPLETTDEFLCQGFLQAIGKDIIFSASSWLSMSPKLCQRPNEMAGSIMPDRPQRLYFIPFV